MDELKNVEQQSSTQTGEKEPLNWKKETCDWIFSIAIAIIIALIIRHFVFTIVKVDGPSMNPTLTDGDTLFTTKLFYEPKVGDVIIFRPPNSPKTPYVKRIIALEGQIVDIDPVDGTVSVDSKTYDEPYIKEPISRIGDMQFPYTVPEGCVFVLGDNRNNSHDSRDSDVGAVPVENIIGKAQFRILPLNKLGSVK